MNFGYGPANDVARRLLTLWNTYRFLVLNANPEGFRPLWEEADRGPESDNPLDRWVIARASELARDCRAALDAYDTPSMTRAVEAFWDDLSNWYVRRSRPRFWEGDRVAFATLHHALVQCLRLMGAGDAVPDRRDVAEPGGERLWRGRPRLGPPGGLSGARRGAHRRRPAAGADGRRARGRRARARARADAKLRVRQPLASAVVAAADAARLKRSPPAACSTRSRASSTSSASTTTSDLEQPRGSAGRAELPRARPAPRGEGAGGARRFAAGAYELGDDGVVHVAGELLAPGEYELRSHAREGFEAQTDGTLVVAIDTRVTDELALEGTARDVVRFLQNVRKELGLEVSDRIAVALRGRRARCGGADCARRRDRARGARAELRAGRRRRSPVRGGRREIAFEVARA